MTHLSNAELVDLIEDAAGAQLPDERRRHADGCPSCRVRVDGLRAVLERALADEETQPSPLFWDHFAARVAEAVRHETPGADQPPAARWPVPARATWAAVAAMAVLMMLAVVWRATLHAPDSVGRATTTVEAPGPRLHDAASASLRDEVDADEAWAVVRTAAEGLGWDDAQAAGISAHPGSAEGVALELTAEERSELGRLLAAEMKRRGA